MNAIPSINLGHPVHFKKHNALDRVNANLAQSESLTTEKIKRYEATIFASPLKSFIEEATKYPQLNDWLLSEINIMGVSDDEMIVIGLRDRAVEIPAHDVKEYQQYLRFKKSIDARPEVQNYLDCLEADDLTDLPDNRVLNIASTPPFSLFSDDVKLYYKFTHLNDPIPIAKLIKVMPFMTYLLRLDLSNYKELTDEDLVDLITIAPHLKELRLRNCVKITDRAVKMLPFFCCRLEKLDLSNCKQITDSAIRSLKDGCKDVVIGLVGCDKVSKTCRDELVAAIINRHSQMAIAK